MATFQRAPLRLLNLTLPCEFDDVIGGAESQGLAGHRRLAAARGDEAAAEADQRPYRTWMGIEGGYPSAPYGLVELNRFAVGIWCLIHTSCQTAHLSMAHFIQASSPDYS